MTLAPRTPVLVGAGVAHRRCADPAQALEPCALMVEAVEAAARDAGTARVLAEADSIRVPRGFWEYSDPGRLIADAMGATRASTVLAEIGILQQTLLSDACNAIASGAARIVIVAGGEAKYRSLRAGITGVELADTRQTDAVPDEVHRPHDSLWHDIEPLRGLVMPVQFFSVIDSAMRYRDGQTLDEHRDAISEMWAAMSRVAVENPHVDLDEPVAAAEIRAAGDANPMLSFPYTKRHNTSWNVDQAAGLILCSVEAARELGIDAERWIYARAGTESNNMVDLSARADMDRCPAIEIAGGRALELAGISAADVDHLELYSCFPAAVRMFARELGFSEDRPLTVTGGMAFAGGPLNNYVLQATARMAEVLRSDPGSTGLVTSVSGLLTKQGFGIWSSEPAPDGWGYADCTDEVAQKTPTREIVPDAQGAATVAGYTVVHLAGTPAKGVAVCDLPDGRRAVAATEDAALARRMTEKELCGQHVLIARDGSFSAKGF